MINTLKIKQLIEEKKILQKDFADSLGITVQGLQHIFRHKSTNSNTLEKIALELGVTVGYFFDEDLSESGTDVKQVARGKGIKQNVSFSDAETQMKILEAENAGLRRELAAKDKIIDLLEKQISKK